jgi:hypothetical protein
MILTAGKTIVVKQTTEGDVPHDGLTLAINIAFGTACRKFKRFLDKQRVHKAAHTKHIFLPYVLNPTDDEATH